MNYIFGMAIFWLVFGMGGWLVGFKEAWVVGIVVANVWLIGGLIVGKM